MQSRAIPPTAPLYAARLIAGFAPGARAPRAVQSGAAQTLVRELRALAPAAALSSKAHSRAMAAAAVAPAGLVGVDVEHHSPGRPIRAIAKHLFGTEPRSDAASYRAFTFREAYFKAFQLWPDRDLANAVAASTDRAMRFAYFSVLHHGLGEEFSLTLIWTTHAEPVCVTP